MRVFDIRSYGAIGDDSTDNTTAIQAAVTAAATSGGAVYIPSGTFRSGQINLASQVSIFGHGYASCIKTKASNNNPLLAVGSGYTDDVSISRIRIDGNKANNTAGYAIDLVGRRCVIENCYIHDAVAGAIYHGGNATDTPLAGSLRIVNNYILNPGLSGAGGGGIAIVHGSHVLIANNIIESIDGYMAWGINIEPNGGEIIDDIAIHNNVIKGGRVYLDCANLESPGTNIHVTGNTIDARGSGGGASLADNACPFYLRNLERLHISGNLCTGHEDSNRGAIFVGGIIQQFQIVNNLFFPQAGSGSSFAISFLNADANMAVDGMIADNYIYGLETVTNGIHANDKNNIVRVFAFGNVFTNITNEYAIGTADGYAAGGFGAGPSTQWTMVRTWDPGSIADGASASTTLTFLQAAVGDWVHASFSGLPAGMLITASVTATDTVSVTLFNKTGSAQDLPSSSVRMVLMKFKNTIYY